MFFKISEMYRMKQTLGFQLIDEFIFHPGLNYSKVSPFSTKVKYPRKHTIMIVVQKIFLVFKLSDNPMDV